MDRCIRVMIVTDHPVFADGIRSAFSCTDDMALVCQARNVVELIRQFKRCNPDLAIVDLQLPKREGECAVHLLRVFSAAIPILVLAERPGEAAPVMLATGKARGLVREVVKTSTGEAIVAAARAAAATNTSEGDAIHRSF
jgi:DNA-binding NarL/FixJ family response regulator